MVVAFSHGRLKWIDAEAKPGERIDINGEEWIILEECGRDAYLRLRRGPQVILPEVAGFITSKIMPKKDWIVVDAGGGSGFMSIYLSYLVPDGEVHVFEKRKEHLKVLERNVKRVGASNIVIHAKPLEEMELEFANYANLDLKGAENFIQQIRAILPVGGFISVYSPQIEQAINVHRNSEGFHAETFEMVERKWKVDVKGYTHPEYQRCHTGFITILRKIE